MTRGFLSWLLLLTLGLAPGWAQTSDASRIATPARGPHLGVQPVPVPEILYEHLPTLPRGQGVVVAEVLPDSPAAKVKLQRHDILLSYDGKPIESCEQFARLLAADKPDRKVYLRLLRGGKETAVEPTLTSGPVLTVDVPEPPRGTAKETNPAKVSVSASPVSGDVMAVTIEYYLDGTGKLKTVTCQGTPNQIDNEIAKLPQRVQDLARTALERIRALERKEPAPRPSERNR